MCRLLPPPLQGAAAMAGRSASKAARLQSLLQDVRSQVEGAGGCTGASAGRREALRELDGQRRRLDEGLLQARAVGLHTHPHAHPPSCRPHPESVAVDWLCSVSTIAAYLAA